LATGYWPLAIGHWLLATGYWLLAIGYRLLATGYWLPATGYRLIYKMQKPPGGRLSHMLRSFSVRSS